MLKNSIKILPLLTGLMCLVSWNTSYAQDFSYKKYSGTKNHIHSVTYESGQSFYHFPIRLTPDNTRLVLPGYKSRYNNAPWTFKDGLFEFYIKKEALPIKAPKCQKYVVVRSPFVPCGTGNENTCQQQRAQREALYHDIEYNLSNGGGINVVLETIPGFTVVSKGEPVLNSCNLYLRTYKNEYIGYTGPLKQLKQ